MKGMSVGSGVYRDLGKSREEAFHGRRLNESLLARSRRFSASGGSGATSKTVLPSFALLRTASSESPLWYSTASNIARRVVSSDNASAGFNAMSSSKKNAHGSFEDEG